MTFLVPRHVNIKELCSTILPSYFYSGQEKHLTYIKIIWCWLYIIIEIDYVYRTLSVQKGTTMYSTTVSTLSTDSNAASTSSIEFYTEADTAVSVVPATADVQRAAEMTDAQLIYRITQAVARRGDKATFYYYKKYWLPRKSHGWLLRAYAACCNAKSVDPVYAMREYEVKCLSTYRGWKNMPENIKAHLL